MKTLRLILVGFVVLTASGYLFLANPFNLFVSKSSRFSKEKFESVRVGMKIEDVVRLLGEPIRKGPLRDPPSDCMGCYIYYFMGDPPEWLHFYQEAWLYVGPEGRVRWKILHSEP
jgi:hypothetical protein